MIPRTALLPALLYAAAATAAIAHRVCIKLEDCPQLAHLHTDECQPYHHFLARGSTSKYPGHVIETVGKVCDALNTQEMPSACGYEDIVYPAQTGGERWCKSAHEGALNAAAQMRNYTARCPDSHLIVMGFSQGASVMLDTLGGGGGEMWSCTQEENPGLDITSPPGSKVAAIVVFGATRRSKGMPWTHGGGQVSDGGHPRTDAQNAGLQPYHDAGLLREYCQPGDPICAPHTPDRDVALHLDYFQKWGDEAAAWTVDRARNATAREPGWQTSPGHAAKDMLKKTIGHPIANVFLALIVLGAVVFLVYKIVQWRTSASKLQTYVRVNTTDTV